MHGCCLLSVHLRLIWSFMVTKLDLFVQFCIFVLTLLAASFSYPLLADYHSFFLRPTDYHSFTPSFDHRSNQDLAI